MSLSYLVGNFIVARLSKKNLYSKLKRCPNPKVKKKNYIDVSTVCVCVCVCDICRSWLVDHPSKWLLSQMEVDKKINLAKLQWAEGSILARVCLISLVQLFTGMYFAEFLWYSDINITFLWSFDECKLFDKWEYKK